MNVMSSEEMDPGAQGFHPGLGKRPLKGLLLLAQYLIHVLAPLSQARTRRRHRRLTLPAGHDDCELLGICALPDESRHRIQNIII